MRIATQEKINLLLKSIAISSLVVALLVIIGWLIKIPALLNIIPSAATMKLNTAISFAMCGLAILWSTRNRGIEKKISPLQLILALGVILIGAETLAEYIFQTQFTIDSLILKDTLSHSIPGRMSLATSVCFIVIGGAILGVDAKKKFVREITQYSLLAVSIIALISLDAYLLQIPTSKRLFFLDSMAIHTSLLFFLIATGLSFKNPTLGFTGLFLGKYEGSKSLRFLLPFIILVPLVLSYILIDLTQANYFEEDFGIAIYTVLLILVCAVYISFNSVRLNNTHKQRLKLETSLREANVQLGYFKKALDESFMLSSSDENDVIFDVNDKLCEKSQYSKEEIIGKTHNIFNSGYHTADFFKTLWDTVLKGEIWIGEINNKTRNGDLMWLRTTIVPFANESGKVYKFLTIRQDITLEKEAEGILKEYVNKLEHQNQELDQYNYITSHDLQEPLRTISSFVELLETEYSSQFDDQARLYFDFISQASCRMRNLINSLLEYSRIGGNRELAPVDCNLLVSQISNDLNKIIKENDATILYKNLPVVNGYETELRLLIQNLIHNAIKFRKKEIAPIIEISAHEEPEKWVFSVKDNGIGIADKYLKKIFIIFQRLHDRDTFEGTGIGLAHCKKVVRLHGGQIWAESQPGEGSTFFFTIPALN
tara:strand:+ start:130920 stop:132884 length:1965 start_codon:yes stop_codon:yes gene_type:complete